MCSVPAFIVEPFGITYCLQIILTQLNQCQGYYVDEQSLGCDLPLTTSLTLKRRLTDKIVLTVTWLYSRWNQLPGFSRRTLWVFPDRDKNAVELLAFIFVLAAVDSE